MFALFVPPIADAGRPLGIGASDVVRVVWRQLVAALTAAGVGFLLQFTILANTAPVARTGSAS